MNKNYILAINEGEKTEKQIEENIKRIFFLDDQQSNIIIIPFKCNIYALWNALNKDEFLDIKELLIERNTDEGKKLEAFKDKISQIFLFFDYDGQDTHASDTIIKKMIETFNNETDKGKIYISYPMVEVIKDFNLNGCSCNYHCNVAAKENIKYKQLAATDSSFDHLTCLTKQEWDIILEHSLRKAACITSACYILPDYGIYQKEITQKNIFKNQLEKYIKKNHKIATISGFPFFLIDYFGEELYRKIPHELKDNSEDKCNTNRT